MLLLNRSDSFWLRHIFTYRYPAKVVVVVVVPLPRGVRLLLACLLRSYSPCLSVVGRSIGHVVS